MKEEIMSPQSEQELVKKIRKGMVLFSGGRLLRNRALLAVSLTVFASFSGLGMVNTVRVLYAQSHGASLGIISAMGSAYLIANFIFQYPAGWVADHWGRRQVMIVGLV